MINLIKRYKELITYMIFGVATTVVNWVFYTICVELLNYNITVSNALAWFISVFFAYITNKLFVFEDKGMSIRLLLKQLFVFFATRLFSGIIEIFLPTFLFHLGINQSLFGIDGFVAKLLVSIIVIVLNYIFSKFLIFKKK